MPSSLCGGDQSQPRLDVVNNASTVEAAGSRGAKAPIIRHVHPENELRLVRRAARRRRPLSRSALRAPAGAQDMLSSREAFRTARFGFVTVGLATSAILHADAVCPNDQTLCPLGGGGGIAVGHRAPHLGLAASGSSATTSPSATPATSSPPRRSSRFASTTAGSRASPGSNFEAFVGVGGGVAAYGERFGVTTLGPAVSVSAGGSYYLSPSSASASSGGSRPCGSWCPSTRAMACDGATAASPRCSSAATSPGPFAAPELPRAAPWFCLTVGGAAVSNRFVMQCSNCGRVNPASAVYCLDCGHKLRETANIVAPQAGPFAPAPLAAASPSRQLPSITASAAASTTLPGSASVGCVATTSAPPGRRLAAARRNRPGAPAPVAAPAASPAPSHRQLRRRRGAGWIAARHDPQGRLRGPRHRLRAR
jgi:hypothetical protein